MNVIKKPLCFWCGRKVSEKVGIHPTCWENLKSFALKI